MNELFKPGDIFTFTRLIFTTEYYDAEGDEPFDVNILNIPIYGVLIFNNIIQSQPFVFNIEDVEKLKYIRVSKEEYSEDITFKTSDNNPNKLYSNMATFTINVNEYINLPPDSIGDNSLTTTNRTTIVFTQADFTTNTTPPYDDPEGDAPYKLKVLSLPTQGQLQLNGIPVTLNQEILFTQINSGLLTYQPTNTDAAYNINFNFTISDAGSEQFFPV